MIIKVCGMREPQNIREVAALAINWIGFIFYERSKRFVERCPTEQQVTDSEQLSPKKVGVFVNATIESMIEKASAYKLDYLQLHGNESPEDCHTLQKRGYSLIKAFPIATKEDFEKTREYEGRVDYFLFDTRCEGYGGSGKRFDWSILTGYKGETPFLLSGGIRPENAEAIRNFRHPRLAGIDLNSGFEIEPGLKDIDKLKNFIQQILHLTVMNRITNLFQTQKDGILSVYFTAGYPNLNDTASILKALQAKGIHMVEVGIPFSDPMADGPVIQEAATQALRNGMSLHLLFGQLREIRSEVQIPIILMGYLNPIMQYGFEKFCASCVEAGVDGMIIPDLPYADYIADYKEIRPIVQQGDLYRLISPYDKTGYASLMYVAPGKDRAVWFVYKLEHFLNMPSPAFRMAGLDPGKRYLITELNVDGKPVPQDGKTFSGAFLMENGLEFAVGKEYASRILELKAVE